MRERITLAHRAPYDWDAIHAFLAHRAIPGIERAEPGVYARSFALHGRRGTLTVTPGDDGLVATIRGAGDAVPQVVARLRHLFDCDADPAVIRAGLAHDPDLAPLVAARPGLRVPGAWDGFELAVRAVLGQQVSVAAATRLAGRLVAAFGTELAPDEAVPDLGLTHAFPAPERLAEADIALSLGMPRARGRAIQGIAARVAADPGFFAMPPGLDAAVAHLRALPGIGEWTAQYIAMRALHEPDALPVGDIGLMRALDRGAGRPSQAELLARSRNWRPLRAYAALHLWTSDAAP